jgi:hypothetical protein
MDNAKSARRPWFQANLRVLMLLMVVAAELMAAQYYRLCLTRLGEPRLSVARTKVDLGPITAKPAGIQTSLQIHNHGGSNLKLQPVKVSNGLRVSSGPRVVGPGDWTSVWLQLDTPPEAVGSHLERTFTINSNDPRRPEVTFTIEADLLPAVAESDVH